MVFMFLSNPLAILSILALALAMAMAMAILIVHILRVQVRLLRSGAVRPFSIGDARDVLAGRHVRPGDKGFFNTGHGRVALWLFVLGLFGLCSAAIWMIIA